MFATIRSVQAAPIVWGDFMGNTVMFVDVTENSGTDPDHFPPLAIPPDPNAGLFGKPIVSGDSLDFTPINFDAISQFQSPAFDHTDGHLTFVAMAKGANDAIQNIKFAEGGALTVAGIGTNMTLADVSAVGFLQISHVDGNPINVITIDIDLKFNFGSNGVLMNNGEWRLGSQGIVNGFPWKGEQLIDLNQELINRGITNFTRGATKVTVSLDNTLMAQSELQGGAFIDKKDFFIVTVNVPEPASCGLAMLGLLAGFALVGRSRG